MRKFTDFLLESNSDDNHSYWGKVKPALERAIDEAARDLEEKIQEFGGELISHQRFLHFSVSNPFGFGVNFRVGDKTFLLVDDFRDQIFFMYDTTDKKDKYSKGTAVYNSTLLLDCLKYIKNAVKGQKVLDVYVEEDEGEGDGEERRIDVTDIPVTTLSSYAKAIHKKILSGLQAQEYYTTTFYHKSHTYRMMGGKRGFNVMDEQDRDVKIT